MQNDLITMTGRVGTEPEHRLTPTGGELASFRLASDVRRRNAEGEWEAASTNWYTVTCWGGLGKNVLASVRKGQRLFVHGRMRINAYTGKDGAPRTTPEITAEVVGHDLNVGTVQVSGWSAGGEREQRGGPDAPRPEGADDRGAWAPPLPPLPAEPAVAESTPSVERGIEQEPVGAAAVDHVPF